MTLEEMLDGLSPEDIYRACQDHVAFGTCVVIVSPDGSKRYVPAEEWQDRAPGEAIHDDWRGILNAMTREAG